MTGPRSAGFHQRAHQQPHPSSSGPPASAVLALGLRSLARELAEVGFMLGARSPEPLKSTEEGESAVGLAAGGVVVRIVEHGTSSGCHDSRALRRDAISARESMSEAAASRAI